jgi:hypothetical protein
MRPRDTTNRTTLCLLIALFAPPVSATISACLIWLPLILLPLRHPPKFDLAIHLIDVAVAVFGTATAAAFLPLRARWRVVLALGAILPAFIGYCVSYLIACMLMASFGNAVY